MKKNDVDIFGEFAFDQRRPGKNSSHAYSSFNVFRKMDNSPYKAYLLLGIANPTAPVLHIYQYIAETIANSPTSLLAEFLLNKILLSPYFLQYSQLELAEYIFGKQLNEEESRFLKDLIKLRDGVTSQEMTASKAVKEIKAKYPQHPLKPEQESDRQLIIWFLTRNLSQIKYLPTSIKLDNLQKLQERLSEKKVKIFDFLRWGRSEKLYKREPTVFIPCSSQESVSLEDLMISNKLNEKVQIPSPKAFALKFYNCLKQFEREFCFHYPCLSLNNLHYLHTSGEFQLKMFPMVLHMIGMPKIPMNFNSVMESLSRNVPQFWKAPQREQNEADHLLITEATALWEYLAIVDYYEQQQEGYFLLGCKNRRALNNKKKYLDKMVREEKQSEYFGGTVCQIIRHCRSKGYTEWRNDKCRAPLSCLQDYFYSLPLEAERVRG